MPHIHTKKGQHDQTVTAYIIRTDGPLPLAMLHLHKKLGKLMPVGGHIELNESPWQAMEHELLEESGYLLKDLMILQPKSRIKQLSRVTMHPYPVSLNTHDITDNHHHSDISYALMAKSLPRQKIKAGESSDIRWVTQKEMNSISDSDIFLNTKEVYNFIFDDCLKNWSRVKTSEFKL